MFETFTSSVWQEFDRLYHEVQEKSLTAHLMPTRRWNELVDQLVAAEARVRSHPSLLEAARRRAETTSDRAELAELYVVLGGAVSDHCGDLTGLRTDPRVDLRPDQLLAAPAIYLAECPSEYDPYEAEDREAHHRDLTRIGGAPTQASTLPYPEGDAFLLQIDFSGLGSLALYDQALAETLGALPAPADGLLQVFHTTTGDSRTDPTLAGGGGTLRYIPDEAVQQRLPPRHRREDYPAVEVRASALPTFHTGTLDEPGGAETGRIFSIVEQVQEQAYRIARNGSYTDQQIADMNHNPFTAQIGAVTHLFGLQSPDYELEPEDHVVLATQLPLRDTSDTHVLLLNISADQSFDKVFGDGGRLEYWVRHSDLAANRFDRTVTFMRSQ